MKITVKLWGPLKHLSQKDSCELTLSKKSNLTELVQLLAKEEESIADFLVDEKGTPVKSTIICINSQQYVWGTETELCESDDIILMSPIAGG